MHYLNGIYNLSVFLTIYVNCSFSVYHNKRSPTILIFIIEERDRVIKVLRNSLYGGAFMSGNTIKTKTRHERCFLSYRVFDTIFTLFPSLPLIMEEIYISYKITLYFILSHLYLKKLLYPSYLLANYHD